jgi:hypothetical protein
MSAIGLRNRRLGVGRAREQRLVARRLGGIGCHFERGGRTAREEQCDQTDDKRPAHWLSLLARSAHVEPISGCLTLTSGILSPGARDNCAVAATLGRKMRATYVDLLPLNT